MDWIDQFQDRNKWWAVVNTESIIHKMWRIYWSTADLLAS